MTLHIALCFFPCRQGQDALRLGRYGTERLACLPGRHQPCRHQEAHPHGLVDHGDSTVAVLGQGDRCLCCACRSGSPYSFTCLGVQRQVSWLRSAVAAINKVVYTPVVAQSLIPMASQTIEIPLLPYTCGRCPCCVGRASSTVAVGEETVALPQLQLLSTSIGWRHHSGRGSFTDRRPCCEGRASG